MYHRGIEGIDSIGTIDSIDSIGTIGGKQIFTLRSSGSVEPGLFSPSKCGTHNFGCRGVSHLLEQSLFHWSIRAYDSNPTPIESIVPIEPIESIESIEPIESIPCLTSI